MWKSEQKNYTLQSSKKDPVANYDFSKINLKVNGKLTTIKLLDLFEKISNQELENDDDLGYILVVQGWSLLQDVKNGKLNDIDISFFSEELGDLNIVKIKNPLWQMSDKNIDEDVVKSFHQKILELAKSKDEPQPIVEELPHRSDPVGVINPNYENAKERFLNSGYKEFQFIGEDGADYRLLENKERNKVKLVHVISPTEVKEFANGNPVTLDGDYIFVDNDENKEFRGKVVDGTLIIKINDLPAKVEETTTNTVEEKK